MTRNRSKLLQAAIALVLLIMSTVLLWPSLGTSAAYASCNPPNNDACITNGPAGTVSLNGKDQILYYKLDFSLNNTNNTAGGWHVTITSTQFMTTSIATNTPTRTLSVNASSVTAV